MECVGEASNGPEAVEQFVKLRPDVMLLDLNMPDTNGLEALRLVREQVRDARVVVLTTYSGDVLANRALKAGALGYLHPKSAFSKLNVSDRSHAIASAMERGIFQL